MFPLVMCGVLLAGLFGALFVIRRRSHAEQVGTLHTTRPDPTPLARSPDDPRCGFCEEPGRFPCRACGRRTCAEHRPYPDDRFCYPCEAGWGEGSRRRSLVIVPIVLLCMASTALLAVGAVELVARLSSGTRPSLGFAVILAPVVSAVPVYLWCERRFRRRYRPPGVPTARAR